jgi:single-stranded-DNA-specific exonuclease
MSDDDTHLVRARQALRNVAAVVPQPDGDGLAAAAIALRERGEGAGSAVLLERGVTPWSPGAPLPDGPLAILDWGMRELDRPALIVDHHAPEAAPRADQVFVNGYGAVPEAPTAALMRRIVPDAPAWLAAVGAVADLGDEGFELAEADENGRDAVRRVASAVNAAPRVPGGPVRTALELLVESEDARGALADPRFADLDEAKRACKAEVDRVIRGAIPKVGESIALVRFSSPCEVQPLIAMTWARRLSPMVVIAANDGYLPGCVTFALRGGEGSLPALLRSALPHDAEGAVAHGHDRATGGSLEPADFESLVEALGLPRALVHAA